MSRRRRFLVLGLASAFAAAGGTAWAIAQDGESTTIAPAADTLAQGETPNGNRYVISRVKPAGGDSADGVCFEISTPTAAAQGCSPAPDGDGRIDGEPWRPSMAVLGSDRFFTTIAPEGVTAMEVRVEGTAAAIPARTVDAGQAGKLLVAVLGGRVVSSRDPESSRNYEVRLVAENDDTMHRAEMSDSG
jgi:hypothetical protein